MALDPPDHEALQSWQDALDRFDRYFWPLFQSRGYSKEAAYLYWTLHRIESTLEDITIINDAPRRDDDGDEWKRT